MKRYGMVLGAALLVGCSSDNDAVLADAARDASAAAAAKALLVASAKDLQAAARAIRAAAPAKGWTAMSDASSVAAMKAAWKDARRAYQGLEGVADDSFPDLDASIDARYDDVLAQGPDPDAFDGQGFVGLHAIERILWSDAVPPIVTAFESQLAGYLPPAFPSTDADAGEFRDGLCARLVEDADALAAKVAGLTIDSPTAFQGAAKLVAIQIVKIEEAGYDKDESRYAGNTLAEMRADVAASEATYGVFRSWLRAKTGGPDADAAIGAGFAHLEADLGVVHGDGLPTAPSEWSSLAPTASMLKTPFGTLFTSVGSECDASRDRSLANALGRAVTVLGLTPPPADAAPPVRPSDPT